MKNWNVRRLKTYQIISVVLAFYSVFVNLLNVGVIFIILNSKVFPKKMRLIQFYMFVMSSSKIAKSTMIVNPDVIPRFWTTNRKVLSGVSFSSFIRGIWKLFISPSSRSSGLIHVFGTNSKVSLQCWKWGWKWKVQQQGPRAIPRRLFQ